MPIPLLYGLLLATGVGTLLKLALSESKNLITKSSNCHDEFLNFNENLNVTKSKLRKLKTARTAIQKKIKRYFGLLEGYSIPVFSSQGSSVIGTQIRTKKDLCDFDVGIYFFREPPHSYETIQKHIKKALAGHTKGKIILLDKCVRLKYSGDFHLDMPVYYKDGNDFILGAKGDVWEICDSKKFKDWVKTETSNNGQIIRLIRYFKAWADKYTLKLPSGLAFTIWTVENYEYDERDDVAFVQTAAKILKHLKHSYWSPSSWECEMPVEPRDNVIGHLDEEKKRNFKLALEKLLELGVKALSAESKENSLKSWRKMFGNRFEY